MADKLVAVRIKQQDNTYSNEIPIGAKAENVAYDNTKNLLQVLGTIDMYKGNVQTQLDALFENFNGIAEDVAGAIDDWITEHIPSWDPEEHLDDTLTADNLAPVSSAVPKLIAVNEAEIQGTKMKISTISQEDLTVLTPNDIDNTLSQQGEAADAKATGEMIMINNPATNKTKIRLETTNEDINILTVEDIDNTLSIEGTVADAKVTGEAINDLMTQLTDIHKNIFEYQIYQKTIEVKQGIVFKADIFAHINAGQHYYFQLKAEDGIISGRPTYTNIYEDENSGSDSNIYVNLNQRYDYDAIADIRGLHFQRVSSSVLKDGIIKIILGIKNSSSITEKLNDAENNIILNSNNISDLQTNILDLQTSISDLQTSIFKYKAYQETIEVKISKNISMENKNVHINTGQNYYIYIEMEDDIITPTSDGRLVLTYNLFDSNGGAMFPSNQNITANQKNDFTANVDIYGFKIYKQASSVLKDGNIKIILGIENSSSIEERLDDAENNIILNSTNISNLQENLQINISNLQGDISYLQEADRQMGSNISNINILYNNLDKSKIKKPLTNPNGIEGQILKSLGDGNTEWSTFGAPTIDQINTAVDTAINTYMNTHPESVTTILDNSITYNKFTDATKLRIENSYITPEMYGAVGDGTTDDIQRFNAAISDALAQGITIKLTGGKTYYLSEGLVIPKGDKIKKLCMESDTIATIKVAYGFSPLIKIGSYTILKNIKFEAALNGNNTSHYTPSNLHNLTGVWVAGSSCYLENITASMCYKGFYLCNDWIYGEGTRESCQFNKIIDCNAENCIIGLDIYADGREIEVDSETGKETVTASGFSNEHDIIRLKNTSTSTYTNLFRKHTEWGYDQEYFIYIRHSQDNPYANNCIRFIDCSFENAFNGVYAISSYCMFINCRTDHIGKSIVKEDENGNTVYKQDGEGNIITDESGNGIPETVFCPGKYYTFINEINNGSNVVLGGYGSAYQIVNNQPQRSIEEIGLDGKPAKVNYILFNRYPFRASMLGFKNDPSMTLSNAISGDDAGIIAYGANLNPPRPIYWDGTKWKDFMGQDI